MSHTNSDGRSSCGRKADSGTPTEVARRTASSACSTSPATKRLPRLAEQAQHASFVDCSKRRNSAARRRPRAASHTAPACDGGNSAGINSCDSPANSEFDRRVSTERSVQPTGWLCSAGTTGGDISSRDRGRNRLTDGTRRQRRHALRQTDPTGIHWQWGVHRPGARLRPAAATLANGSVFACGRRVALSLLQLAPHQRRRRAQVEQRVLRLGRLGLVRAAGRRGRSFRPRSRHAPRRAAVSTLRAGHRLGLRLAVETRQTDSQGAGSHTQGWHPFRVQLATPFGDFAALAFHAGPPSAPQSRASDTSQPLRPGTPLANSCWLESDGPCRKRVRHCEKSELTGRRSVESFEPCGPTFGAFNSWRTVPGR